VLTGTPLDLTPFGGALGGLGWLYWLLALGGLLLALTKPPDRGGKIFGVAMVVLLFGSVPAYMGLTASQGKARLTAATAQFQLRCKTAGEKISRVVENVDGVVWMKWRDTTIIHSDQFKLDDPYGRDCGEENCIEKLLRVTKGADLNQEEARRHKIGYRFVETEDPSGKLYRYTGVIKLRPIWTEEALAKQKAVSGKGPDATYYAFAVEKEAISKLTAQYGATWEDVSTHEDREHWVAGGSLKIVDLNTREVIAERVGYMMDRGLGSQEGFRSPWPSARYYGPSCLSPSKHGAVFIVQVLKPIQGE